MNNIKIYIKQIFFYIFGNQQLVFGEYNLVVTIIDFEIVNRILEIISNVIHTCSYV